MLIKKHIEMANFLAPLDHQAREMFTATMQGRILVNKILNISCR